MSEETKTLMSDPRIIPCEHCQTEGRIYRGQYEDERDCGPCPFCEGTGGEIIETEPIEMEDIDRMDMCSHCGARINPMLYPCMEQGCPNAGFSREAEKR